MPPLRIILPHYIRRGGEGSRPREEASDSCHQLHSDFIILSVLQVFQLITEDFGAFCICNHLDHLHH